MTDGGMGVAFFSPFDTTRYFLPWRPILVSPISVMRFLSERGLAVFAKRAAMDLDSCRTARSLVLGARSTFSMALKGNHECAKRCCFVCGFWIGRAALRALNCKDRNASILRRRGPYAAG